MKKRFKKIFIFGIIFGVVVAGIAGYFILNSSPEKLTQEQKEQAIADILGRKPNLDPDIKTGETTYEGKLLSFSYPARAVIYDHINEGSANNESIVDRFSFDLDNPRLVLNFTAANKPSLSKIDDEPGVKLRSDTSRGYESEDVTVDGVQAVAYGKEGGGSVKAEKTAFILKDSVIYTISITGPSLEDAVELFDQIIKSAKFN